MQQIELPEQNETIDLRQYLALVWQWAWLISLAVVLTGVASFFISRQMTPVYQATTTLLINEAPSSKTADYTSLMTSERLARTYSEMMVKEPIKAEVARRLGMPSLDGINITVAPVRDTQLISISVESPDAMHAALIANLLVAVFSDQIQSLQAARFDVSKQSLQQQLTDIEGQIRTTSDQLSTTKDITERDRLENKVTQYRQIYSTLLSSYEEVRLAETQTTSSVTQVEPALPPHDPIRPRILINTGLAAVVGLMLSLGVIFGIEILDDTLKNPEQITRELGLPILGVISHYKITESEDVPIAQVQPRSPISEAFRTLRTNVQYASVGRPLHSILVTSPSPGEGKTTVIANLAVVMAQSGRHVTVVDADMRRPTVHKRFGLVNQSGLSGIFVQPTPVLNGALQKTAVSNLTAVTSGSLPPNPSELLGSQRMNEILIQLGIDQEMILIDTPPILAVTDAAVLSSYVDGILLVVKPGSTKTAAARQAILALRRVNANLLGVVLNNMELRHSSYGYYYRKYYNSDPYGYGESRNAAKEQKSTPRPKKSANGYPSEK
jgi:polysaccharide biosynthesis transport protein